MSVVLDTSLVVALLIDDGEGHADAYEWVMSTDEDLVTTPLALAEMDYMIAREDRQGRIRRAMWDDFESGAYSLRWWADGLQDTLRIAKQHPYLGLADASLVALAGILRTNRIATFDQHFRSVSTPDGEAFVVLPADR